MDKHTTIAWVVAVVLSVVTIIVAALAWIAPATSLSQNIVCDGHACTVKPGTSLRLRSATARGDAYAWINLRADVDSDGSPAFVVETLDGTRDVAGWGRGQMSLWFNANGTLAAKNPAGDTAWSVPST